MITNNMNVTERFSGKWETKRLGDIASIRNQKVLPANVNADTPCVELDHIGSGNGQLLKSSTAEYSTASKYRFFAGDVLFGRLRSYLRKFWLADRDGICTTEIWPLMVDTEQVDTEFLHAIVQSDQFFSMASISYGTHMPRTDWGVMRNFTVMLPQVQEQRAIAEVLSDVDGLLNALDALIAKKQAIKQATMQQLLTGRTRLPGFSGAWETKRLGEIAPIRNHKTLPASVNPDTLCVELDHIEQGSGQLLEYAIAQNSRSSKYYFCAGDVLFGRLRPYLRKFWHADRNGICTTEIWPLMANRDQIDSGFLYAIVQSDPFIAAASISYGTHMPRADWNVMRNFEICLPEAREQLAIASVLSDMDAEIAALEQRREKTRAIKQGMMQQLLTGRVRLSESRICTDDTDYAD